MKTKLWIGLVPLALLAGWAAAQDVRIVNGQEVTDLRDSQTPPRWAIENLAVNDLQFQIFPGDGGFRGRFTGRGVPRINGYFRAQGLNFTTDQIEGALEGGSLRTATLRGNTVFTIVNDASASRYQLRSAVVEFQGTDEQSRVNLPQAVVMEGVEGTQAQFRLEGARGQILADPIRSSTQQPIRRIELTGSVSGRLQAAQAQGEDIFEFEAGSLTYDRANSRIVLPGNVRIRWRSADTESALNQGMGVVRDVTILLNRDLQWTEIRTGAGTGGFSQTNP